MSLKENNVIVIGDLQPKNKFGGKVTRQQNCVIDPNGISMSITALHSNHAFKIMEKIKIKANTKTGFHELTCGGVIDVSRPNCKTRRGRVQEDGAIVPAITCAASDHLRVVESIYRIRVLTERECFRLMGVPESDIDKLLSSRISKTRLNQLAGNSIVVDVLERIFDKMFCHTEITELTLF